MMIFVSPLASAACAVRGDRLSWSCILSYPADWSRRSFSSFEAPAVLLTAGVSISGVVDFDLVPARPRGFRRGHGFPGGLAAFGASIRTRRKCRLCSTDGFESICPNGR
jgi:hypothetical protein